MDMSYRFPLLPRWLRWLAVLGVAAVIFYLSIVTAPPEQPVVPAPPDLIPLDKWRHFLAYAAFGGSLAYATADWSWRRRTLAAAVIGTAVMYGIGIEFGQSFLPDRYVSLEDAYANALGGMLVLPWYVLRPSLTMTPVSEWVGGLLDAG
jgi:VanZ family protein